MGNFFPDSGHSIYPSTTSTWNRNTISLEHVLIKRETHSVSLTMYTRIFLNEYSTTRELPPSAGFPSPTGGTAPAAQRLGRPRRPLCAAFGSGKKRKKNWGAYGAHSFKNVRRVMRIPNMCLVLKLDNGKVVSISNGQTEWPNHPVPY